MDLSSKSILIISSANPSFGAGGLAIDYYKALKNEGYDIDFLTKNKNLDYSDFLYIYESDRKNIIFRILNLIHRVIFKLFRIISGRDYHLLRERYFFYKYEKRPPVSNKRLLNTLPKEKDYGLIIIIFWQEMLSAISLEVLYDKYKCPIFIFCADYSPMTGGCHFIADCKTFESGCGACKCWYSKKLNDFTHFNVIEKKRIYQKINPIVFLNKYMDDNYASRSPVLKNIRKEYIFPVINEKLFIPCDKKKSRNALGLDENKKVIFFACQKLNDTRKGIKYILEALDIFYNSLSEENKKKIFVVLAGRIEGEIVSKIKFNSKHFGYVDTNTLIKLFQSSDVFLSGSVIDAGPMMVNQALSCGVPVISFNIGTAMEVINEKNTGYCSKVITAEAFADGIKWWFNLSDSEYLTVSNNCRNMALKTTSYKSFTNKVIETYNSLDSL